VRWRWRWRRASETVGETTSKVNSCGKMIGGLPPQKVQRPGIEPIAIVIGKKIVP
jgi:hypothetical protein